MKRRIFLFVIAAVAPAQIPSDTLVMKLGERDTPQKRFLADNPGAVETLRLERAVHYRKTNGENVAIFASGLNWVDAGSQIVPLAPEMWQTNVGFRTTGSPTVVRIVSGKTQDTIEMWDAATGKVITITSPKLNRTGEWTFEFPWESITWTLEVTPFGWNVTSDPIAASRGVRTYQMPLASSGADPQPDAMTGDLVDGSFRLTRAVMVGADQSRTLCTAWTREPKYVAFVCDDTTLPATAFPYVIDPFSVFGDIGAAADDGHIGKTLATWPVNPGNNYQVSTTTTYNTIGDYNASGFYYRWESLYRYNTSSLPDTVAVTSSTFNPNVNYVDNQNGCPVVAGWVNPSIWTIGYEDFYGGPSPSDALSTTIASGATGLKVWALTNVAANVSLTGYTAFRLAMNCASTPTTNWSNQVRIDALTTANYPALIVYYTEIKPRLIVVSQ